MKKIICIIASIALVLSFTISAFAGTWEQSGKDWYYKGDNGQYVTNQWVGNYYLGADGKMLTNTTTPDGYPVGPDGVWIQNTTGDLSGYYCQPNNLSCPARVRLTKVGNSYKVDIDIVRASDYHATGTVGGDGVLNFSSGEVSGSIVPGNGKIDMTITASKSPDARGSYNGLNKSSIYGKYMFDAFATTGNTDKYYTYLFNEGSYAEVIDTGNPSSPKFHIVFSTLGVKTWETTDIGFVETSNTNGIHEYKFIGEGDAGEYYVIEDSGYLTVVRDFVGEDNLVFSK